MFINLKKVQTKIIQKNIFKKKVKKNVTGQQSRQVVSERTSATWLNASKRYSEENQVLKQKGDIVITEYLTVDGYTIIKVEDDLAKKKKNK